MIADWLRRLVPWYVRWGAVLLLILAAAVAGAAWMHRYDDRRYETLVAEHAAFKARVQQAGENRELQVWGVNAAAQDAQRNEEKSYADVERRRAADGAAVLAELRAAVARLADRGGDQLPGIPGPASAAEADTCVDEQSLVAGIQNALGRLLPRLNDIIGRGAEGVDLASFCRDAWLEQQRIHRTLAAPAASP